MPHSSNTHDIFVMWLRVSRRILRSDSNGVKIGTQSHSLSSSLSALQALSCPSTTPCSYRSKEAEVVRELGWAGTRVSSRTLKVVIDSASHVQEAPSLVMQDHHGAENVTGSGSVAGTSHSFETRVTDFLCSIFLTKQMSPWFLSMCAHVRRYSCLNPLVKRLPRKQKKIKITVKSIVPGTGISILCA